MPTPCRLFCAKTGRSPHQVYRPAIDPKPSFVRSRDIRHPCPIPHIHVQRRAFKAAREVSTATRGGPALRVWRRILTAPKPAQARSGLKARGWFSERRAQTKAKQRVPSWRGSNARLPPILRHHAWPMPLVRPARKRDDGVQRPRNSGNVGENDLRKSGVDPVCKEAAIWGGACGIIWRCAGSFRVRR